MSKPSLKRLGFLCWIRDFSTDTQPCYLHNTDNLLLMSYGISVWDGIIATTAEKAGLIRIERECFVYLTDAGRAILEKYAKTAKKIPCEYANRLAKLEIP